MAMEFNFNLYTTDQQAMEVMSHRSIHNHRSALMAIFETQINTHGNFYNITNQHTWDFFQPNHKSPLMEIYKRSYIAAAGIIVTDKQTKLLWMYKVCNIYLKFLKEFTVNSKIFVRILFSRNFTA